MFCSKCGQELRDDLKFCTNCGAAIKTKVISELNHAEEEILPLGDEKKKRGSGLKLIIIILVIILLGSSAAAFWFEGGKDMIFDMTGKSKEVSQKVSTEPPQKTIAPTAMASASLAPTDSVIERTIAHSVEEALQNYVAFFVEAVNSGDYTDAGYTMQAGSNIYNTQKSVIEKLHQRGIKEELESCQVIETHRINDDTVEVTSNEVIKVYYEDGTQNTVQQSYIYTCVSTFEGYLFTDIRGNESDKEFTEEENESDKEFIEEKEHSDTDKEDTDYILPDADTRVYPLKELKKLSKNKLRLARNEIYARHGYIFNDEELSVYFLGKSWYVPRRKDIKSSDFNKYELKNIRQIQKCEKK